MSASSSSSLSTSMELIVSGFAAFMLRALYVRTRSGFYIVKCVRLSTTLARASIPVMLIYGEKDLIAPPEVGRIIYASIQTPVSQKMLIILPNSRHGAEGPDIMLMQNGVRQFIARTIALRRR